MIRFGSKKFGGIIKGSWAFGLSAHGWVVRNYDGGDVWFLVLIIPAAEVTFHWRTP
jgi:hypothetical protein